MHIVIVYVIGKVKYKQLMVKCFEDKQEAIDKYREYLGYTDNNNELVMALLKLEPSSNTESQGLSDQFNILTAWALGTPKQLKEAALLALSNYEKGEELFVEPNLTLENLYGSQIYEELIELKQSLTSLQTDDVVEV